MGLAISFFMALAARGMAGDEEVTHYLIAHHAFDQPSLFLSLAGRPLVNVVLALPSQAGLIGARMASVLASAVCAYAVARTARVAGLGSPWLAVLFLFIQPFFLAHCGTAMTEPWAAAILAGMLLAITEKRHRLLIILAAIFPLARMETMVFWPAVVLLEWRSPARAWLGVLPVPVLMLHVLGALASGDPLWLLHQSRLQAYPQRELLHYVKSWVWTLGLGLFPAVSLGLVTTLFRARSRDPHDVAGRRALWASAGSALLLLALYSAIATLKPITFGNLRYLAIAAPAFALLGVRGVQEIARGGLRPVHWITMGITLLGAATLWGHPWIRDFAILRRRDVLPVGMAVLWIVLALVASRRRNVRWVPIIAGLIALVNLADIGWRHRSTLHWKDVPEHKAVREAARMLPRVFPSGVRFYAAHPLMAWERGVNPYNPTSWPPITDRLAQTAPPGTVFFWDTHYITGKGLALELRGLIDSRAWKYAGGVIASDSSWAGSFFVRAGEGEDAMRGLLTGGLPANEWLAGARLVHYGIPSGRQNVAADPENPEMWRLLALRYFGAGFATQGWSALQRATLLEPKNARNPAFAAEMYRVRKDFALARQNAEKALALSPGDPRLEFLLGRILVDDNQLEAAIPHLLASARKLKQQPEVQLDTAMVLARLGRLTEAKPHYERAVSLRPNEVKAVIGLMQIEVEEGRPESAIDRARAFIARRPEIAATYVVLGDLLVKLGRMEGARSVWQEGLRATGGDPEIQGRLQRTPQ